MERGIEATGENTGKLNRTENPLFSNLEKDRANLIRFRDTVNAQLRNFNAGQINLPRLEPLGYMGRATVIDIPFNTYSEGKETSLINLIASVSSIQESDDIVTDYNPKQKDYFHITTSDDYLEPNPFGNGGIIVKGRDRRHPEKSKPGTIMVNSNKTPEVILAYETVIAALIAQDKIDMSTRVAMARSLPLRRNIFMDLYHGMIEEMEPFVSPEDIFGMEEQLEDIDTNLYNPLRNGKGKPMNTLLIGAPGTGKSITGRMFMSDRDVITIPVKISQLESFEYDLLPTITKIKQAIDLPTVLLVDDVEALFTSTIDMDDEGGYRQMVNSRKRSEALTLLERMQDTYGVYFLGTLNNPDVEAAFLRRFNPVYFPLPSLEQRKFMLDKIVPTNISPSKRTKLIDEFATESEGFNYHGLAVSIDYYENAQLRMLLDTEEQRVKALQAAFVKASQKVDIEGIRRTDEAARKTVFRPTKVSFDSAF